MWIGAPDSLIAILTKKNDVTVLALIKINYSSLSKVQGIQSSILKSNLYKMQVLTRHKLLFPLCHSGMLPLVMKLSAFGCYKSANVPSELDESEEHYLMPSTPTKPSLPSRKKNIKTIFNHK